MKHESNYILKMVMSYELICGGSLYTVIRAKRSEIIELIALIAGGLKTINIQNVPSLKHPITKKSHR